MALRILSAAGLAVIAQAEPGLLPPVISLDLASDRQCSTYPGCTTILTRTAKSWRTKDGFKKEESFKQEAAICHEREEWMLLLHGGEPGFVDKQCVANEGIMTKTYAKRCNVLSSNETSCPEPSAHVFDHHEGNVDDKLTIQRKLFVESLPQQAPHRANTIASSINYNLRSEYLLAFDATDSSGNQAETVQFAMIFQDHVKPILSLSGSKGVAVAMPKQIESLAGFQRFAALPIPTAYDAYDGDVTNTMTVTIDSGEGPKSLNSENFDTLLLGERTVEIKFNDYASIFGLNNLNNTVTKTFKINVVDETPPIVLCRTGGPVACHLESGKPVCAGAVPCPSAEAVGEHECKRDYTDIGAICIDAHDSSVFKPSTSMQRSLKDEVPTLDTDVIIPAIKHTIDAGSAVYQSEHPVKYTCTDGQKNTAVGTRTVYVRDRTPPNLDVTDDTTSNLKMHLICGDPENEKKLKQLQQLGVGYTATDDCTAADCKVTLHYGNCDGEFRNHDGQLVNGGQSPAIEDIPAVFKRGVAVYHSNQHSGWQKSNLAEEGTADNVNTLEIEGGVYGMKYTCKDNNDNVISKCRTIVNEESSICNPAPIHCELNSWQRWGSCSHSCGSGQQTRARSVRVQPQFGGRACETLSDERPCNAHPCPIDCEIGEWGPPTECTLSCGGGLKYEYRTVTAPQHGGRACPTSTKTLVCNSHECPIDCVFEWHPWTVCDKSCTDRDSSGKQQRSPKISVYHDHGGFECPDLERRNCNRHACPVDCEVGAWSAWSTCSTSCGGGWQTRDRVITEPLFGGKQCPVSDAGQACNSQDCPVDCELESWGGWGECSKSCKGGTQIRRRSVARQPAYGGKACLSQSSTQECNTHYCPIPCSIGTWAAWGSCSHSCGKGTQRSTRFLSQPDFGGEACPNNSRKQDCNTQNCPVNCLVASWSGWTACTSSCGSGSQQRSRTITGEASFGGVPCPTLSASQECNAQSCPVDCLAPFQDWSLCSVTCNPGTQRRERTIKRNVEFGGVVCPPDMVEVIPCQITPCPEHCEVDSWSSWSACTKSCEEGSQKRSRKITQHPNHGGYVCPELAQKQPCNKQPCPTDCVVNSWGPWGDCSKSCGSGSQTRQRRLTEPTFGGRSCPSHLHKMACNTQQCVQDCVVSTWSAWSKCTRTCGTGKKERTRKVEIQVDFGGVPCPPTLQMASCNDDKCPLHCQMGPWTSWSGCEVTCGGGSQARSRLVVQHAQYGGFFCPGTDDERECSTDACPVDCVVSPWTTWSTCDVTCGGGTHRRKRSIMTHPKHGGRKCMATKQQEPCSVETCPVDCIMGTWSKFSICSKSCGGGEQSKVRDILVEATHGGKKCGETSNHRLCNLETCPVDCKIGIWEQWLACDVTCGGGTQTRTRVNTPPISGGKMCPSASENRECHTQHCPKDCFVTSWSSWSDCSLSCGTGYQSKTRAAVPPVFGGKECPLTKEERACNTADCPVDCQLSTWSVWSACSVTCGGGTKRRYRSVNVPTVFGGKDCAPSRSTTKCNPSACPPDPIHCVIGSWSQWGACTKSCGTGVKTRTRTNVAPQHGGDVCPTSSQSATCNAVPCPVDCNVGSWSSWTECTHTCGTEGQTHRHRSIAVKNSHGGQSCPGLTEKTSCNANPCPSDCIRGEWSPFSDCSVSCGAGTKTRSRTLTPPKNGGTKCPSTFVHTESCNQHACPKDCVAGIWSAYGACSTTCGSGSKKRTRSLTPGGLGGAPCPAGEEFLACSLTVCPIDCKMSQWTEFSTCSKSCGGGSQTRTRQVEVSPGFGGKKCPVSQTSKVCGTASCPVDCVLHSWSLWSRCTKSCNSGTRSRTRTHTEPQHGGKHCAAVYSTTEVCNTQACPIDCVPAQWGEWSTCSATCGGGQQKRRRSLTPPSSGGVSCDGVLSTQSRTCNDANCPSDCTVSDWSDWNHPGCSRSCGGGLKTRTRSITSESLYGGKHCPSLSETISCNEHSCPVDCIVHSWHEWSACTQTCTPEGSTTYGSQRRARLTIVGSHGGVKCPAAIEKQECGHVLCPIHCEVNAWSSWAGCTKSCGTGSQTRTRTVRVEAKHGGNDCPGQKHQEHCNTQPCPTDCQMSAWSSWSTCPVSCGGGTQARIRTSSVATYGGKKCGTTKSTQSCNNHPCSQDCIVTLWTPFDDCSVSCGLGSKTRTREVTAPKYGGKVCPKTSDVKSCSWGQCPVGCEVGSWSEWTHCSVSCGGSTQSRKRSIMRKSKAGGAICPNLQDERDCGMMDCPVDCEVGEWGSWTDCTKTCDTGSKSRTRTTKGAKFGGILCPVSEQITLCADFPCPVDCAVATWTPWSTCSEPCGPGTTTRSRKVITQMKHGGKQCEGLGQIHDCLIKHCPVDCVHVWDDWTECSVSCGGGQQSRSLQVQVEAKHGGTECPFAQDRTCNTPVCPTPAPTFAPTPAPSSTPTKTPTPSPTTAPTRRPKPIIDIVGGNIITIEANTDGVEYVDKGAWCTDLHDGDLNQEVTISGDIIDSSRPSNLPKYVDYSCSASDGATAYARRTVYVADSKCPTCDLVGGMQTTVEASFPFKDAGATCHDTFQGSLVPEHQTDLDVETVGTYVITYVATDAFGNVNSGMNCREGEQPTEAKHCCYGGKHTLRTVTVIDTLKPVIGLRYKGSSFLTNEVPGESSTVTGVANPASEYFSKTSLMADFPTSTPWALVAAAAAAVGAALLVKSSRNTHAETRLGELV